MIYRQAYGDFVMFSSNPAEPLQNNLSAIAQIRAVTFFIARKFAIEWRRFVDSKSFRTLEAFANTLTHAFNNSNPDKDGVLIRRIRTGSSEQGKVS